MFVKIVCTAFTVCMAVPTKYILSFDAYRKYEIKSLGEMLA